MITKSPIKRNKTYYEALGLVPEGVLSPQGLYRYRRVKEYLHGCSVLDVGCGRGDFLKLINLDYQISGTEVNKERADYCNQALGQEAVKVDNLDERLDFEDGSFDTVICLEVLEHLVDPQKALKELVRISRKRIIITVPFNENIQWCRCVHCARWTPVSGHLHTLNKENIRGIIPSNARVVKIELVRSRVLSRFPRLSSIFRLPIPIISIIDRVFTCIVPRAGWMMVILNKE